MVRIRALTSSSTRPRGQRAQRERSLATSAAASALAVVALTLIAPSALTQAVDPRLYEPALTPGAVLGVDATTMLPHLAVWGGLFASWANDELLTRTGPESTDHGPLRNRLVTTVAAGFGLFDRLELAVGAPVHVVEVASAEGGRDGEVGFGDLRIAARARVFGPKRGTAGVGLALGADLTLPTAGQRPFSGDDGVGFTPRLALDWRSRGGLVLALNAGYRLRTRAADVDDLAVGDELRFGAAAEVPLGVYGLIALGEVLAAVGLAESEVDPDGVDARKVPVEALAGLRWRSTGGFALSAAGGVGLTAGYGAPDYRVVLSLVYGGPPGEPFVERVLDPALLDAAADPNDLSAPNKQSVALAPVPPLDAAGFDAVAAADPDPDGDGIPSSRDQCPNEPEDFDGFQDEDGCPDPDNDGDGIPDVLDRCPNEPETFNGFEDEDGCPDEAPAGPASTVSEDDGRLVITHSVRFTPGSAELTRAGEEVLDGVVAFMRSRPDIGRVRIEGHTDSIGDKEFNVDLAERRAWSVRSYMMQQGIDGARLLPKGYGPTRPVASNATDAGRARNRRVEFHILRPGDPDGTEERR